MLAESSTSTSDERLMERRRRHLGPAYRHFYKSPLHLVRGEGVRMCHPSGIVIRMWWRR